MLAPVTAGVPTGKGNSMTIRSATTTRPLRLVTAEPTPAPARALAGWISSVWCRSALALSVGGALASFAWFTTPQ